MRYILAILFLLALFVPIALHPTEKRAGNDDLIIITPHNEPIRREFEDAFNEYHKQKYGTAVHINYLNFGGGADIKRTLEARREAGSGYDIDLAWGGGNSLFDQDLKPYLEGLQLDPQLIKDVFPVPTFAGLRLYEGSTPPLWYGTALSSFGIGYNKDILKYLDLAEPKTWSDLKDPRYRGWIVMADPTRSSSAKTAFMAIIERAMADAQAKGQSQDEGWAVGMGLIRLIASNARNFNDSANALPTLVSSGDVAAAMTIDFYARSQIQAVGEQRMGYVEPANATIINPDPIALIQGAPHREIAKQFVEFVLSEQGQRLFNLKAGSQGGPKLTSLRRLPVRRSVYADMTNFTDPVNPFEESSSFNTSPARTKTFGIIGELIQASCMDVLDELKETRAEILASPNAASLDALLGKFPFDQREALRRLALYGKASPIEKLRLMEQWTEDFRGEYAALREQARRKSRANPTTNTRP
jgi:ABC-type Fe3+ transport system substrate-binding protein